MTSDRGGVTPCRRSASSTPPTMSRSESISVPSTSKTTARRSLTVGPMHGVPDEEGTHLHDELRRLPGAAHGLHDVRQGMKLLPDEPDDELVVVGVEAMAREADVVSEVRRAVRFADLRVLAQDPALFLRLQPLEGAAAPERVPHRPGPALVQSRLPGSLEQPEYQIRLVPGGVSAAE